MMIKRLSRKQIVIPIGINNVEQIIAKANSHISNINRLLKEIKSEISVNSIQSNNKGILVTINKIAATSDLNIMEKYLKDLNDINLTNIINPRLSQFKSYLKILNIPYFVKDTNLSVISDIIESIIKSTHIFNNIVLESCLCIIKVFLKSDMTAVWVNIWDS